MGHVDLAILLALEHKNGASEGRVEHGDSLGTAGTVVWVVAADSRQESRLVVVVDIVAHPATLLGEVNVPGVDYLLKVAQLPVRVPPAANGAGASPVKAQTDS